MGSRSLFPEGLCTYTSVPAECVCNLVDFCLCAAFAVSWAGLCLCVLLRHVRYVCTYSGGGPDRGSARTTATSRHGPIAC